MHSEKMANAWAQPVQFPAAGTGHVHVWRVTLAANADQERRARATLCPEELERCDRFKFPHLRRRYAMGRAALRSILAATLGTDPNTISIAYGPQGKPALANPDAQVAFNVSHSEDLALVAVGACEDLGVDVEHRDPRRSCREIAQRFFAPEEVAALDELSLDQYVNGFYRCWTRKEAYIKAVGGGLSIALTSFVVSLDSEPRLLRNADASEAKWSLFAIEPAAGFEACVAARGAGGISWWDWTEQVQI